MKNKQMLIVGAVVVVLAAIVGFSVSNTGDQAKVSSGGKARYILVGDESCDDCVASRDYVQQALEGQDVIFEFVDFKKTPGAIPAIDGAEAEGALVNICDAGDHTTLVYKGGHFTSVEEASAAIGSGNSEAVTATFTYGGDGCDNCLKVKDAFERFSQSYDPASVRFVYYDMATQGTEAAAANLTKAHMLTGSDTDGCTGVRDGEIGTTDEAMLEILQKFQLAPTGSPN